MELGGDNETEMLEQIANARQIGSLNGKWSVLFRALLSVGAVVLPMLVMLNVWFVTAIYDVKMRQIGLLTRMDVFIAEGPRYTPADAKADILELRSSILEQMRKENPPEWLVERMISHERQLEELRQEIVLRGSSE